MSHDTITTAVQFLQWQGAVLGILGAMLVASRSASRRRRGFLCWIASNLGLVVVFIHADLWPLVAMQSFYLATSFVGWFNNRRDIAP